MIRFVLLFILAALMTVPRASAHRIGIPVTTIEWNAQTEVWEVVHRVSAHDLEKYFSGRADLNTLYDAPEGIAMLGAYSASAFDVAGTQIELSYIGAELDRDQVWIYCEMRAEPNHPGRFKPVVRQRRNKFRAGECQRAGGRTKSNLCRDRWPKGRSPSARIGRRVPAASCANAHNIRH